MRILLIILLIISCSKQEKKDPTAENLQKLQEMYNQKTLEYQEVTKNNTANWPADDECDGALWAGVATRGGQKVNISAALQSDGRPTRKPNDDCLKTESAATTSNDMMLGIILGLHYQKDLNSLIKLYNYGKNNNWIMGYPTSVLSRVLMRPNNKALLARSINNIGGPNYPEKSIPLVYLPDTSNDYPTHSQFLSIILAKDTGDIGYLNEAAVQETCKLNQEDALANTVCGNKEKATELLLGDYEYPTYVRGDENYKLAHWLLAAKLIISGF